MNTSDIKGVMKAIAGSENVNKQHQDIFVSNYMQPLLHGKPLPNGATYQIDPDKWSIRGLFEAFGGEVQGVTPQEWYYSAPGVQAIQSTMFPKAVENLALKKLNDSFMEEEYIADRLVRTIPSKTKNETYYGLNELQDLKDAEEAEEVQFMSFNDRWVTTRTMKRQIALALTKEMLMFDQTGLFMERTRRLGIIAARNKEKKIVESVLSNKKGVYNPLGVSTDLYDASVNTVTTFTPLVDEDTIGSVKQHYRTNFKTTVQGEEGVQKVWLPNTIICSQEQEMAIRRIFTAGNIFNIVNASTTSKPAGTGGMTYRNQYAGTFEILTSPYFPDGLDSKTWFLGNFRDQFIWLENWPITVTSLGAGSEADFSRDIVAQFKVSYMGGLVAERNDQVIRNGS